MEKYGKLFLFFFCYPFLFLFEALVCYFPYVSQEEYFLLLFVQTDMITVKSVFKAVVQILE